MNFPPLPCWAGLLGIALAGCAAPLPGGEAARGAGTAEATKAANAAPASSAPAKAEPANAAPANSAPWERAPTPRLIERRYDVWGGSATRGQYGWPDRYTGSPGSRWSR